MDVHGRYRLANAIVTVTTAPAWHLDADPDEFATRDFEERCETCLAPPGQLCQAWCDTGYTAADARADAVRHDTHRGSKPPAS
ncbi:hypothetical protein [Streptomyces sp. NPDC005209]|uniref:hypothetical protein n=1 Tax=Streptomyces sp. NPDC005209 TaxID=3156715 RepID=UPI0033BD5050